MAWRGRHEWFFFILEPFVLGVYGLHNGYKEDNLITSRHLLFSRDFTFTLSRAPSVSSLISHAEGLDLQS